jgi:hypothetical protein
VADRRAPGAPRPSGFSWRSMLQRCRRRRGMHTLEFDLVCRCLEDRPVRPARPDASARQVLAAASETRRAGRNHDVTYPVWVPGRFLWWEISRVTAAPPLDSSAELSATPRGRTRRDVVTFTLALRASDQGCGSRARRHIRPWGPPAAARNGNKQRWWGAGCGAASYKTRLQEPRS